MTIKKMLLVSMLLVFTCFSFGCNGVPRIEGDPSPQLGEAIDENEETQNQIEEVTTSISDTNDELSNKTNELENTVKEIDMKVDQVDSMVSSSGDSISVELKNDIQSIIQNIKEKITEVSAGLDSLRTSYESLQKDTKKLQQLNNNIQRTNEKLNTVEGKVSNLKSKRSELQSDLEKLKKENEELKSSRQEMLNMIWVGLAGMGAVILLGSIGLLIFAGRTRLGIMGATMGVITIGVASALIVYAEYIALAGIVGIAGILVTGCIYGYITYVEKKEKEANEKALEETVGTVEAMKEDLDDDSKKKIFGKGAEPGIAHLLQNEDTRRRINEIRKRKAPEWERTVKK